MWRIARIIAVLALLVSASQSSAAFNATLIRTADQQQVGPTQNEGTPVYYIGLTFNTDSVGMLFAGAGDFNLNSTQKTVKSRSDGGKYSRHFINNEQNPGGFNSPGSYSVLFVYTGSFYMSVVNDKLPGKVDYIKVDPVSQTASWVTRAEAAKAGLITARLSVSGPAAGLRERRGKVTTDQPTSWGAIKQEEK